MSAMTPPEVFPLADGGLEFVWRISGGTVEAEFDADGDILVMISDENGRRAGYAAEMWPEACRFLMAEPGE